MNESEIVARLRDAGIDGVGELDTSAGDPFVVVEADALRPAVRFLRDDEACAMEMCHCVTAVEREAAMEVVYHLCSYEHHHSLTLKVICPRPEGGGHDDWHPEVPSIADIHSAANWHEREQYDLLGVVFTGHPDPRRILLPEEWIGHPLRKDYVYPAAHEGIPLELDAIPLYMEGGEEAANEASAKAQRDRPAGTPLEQPASKYSKRPDAGGEAPPESEGKLNSSRDSDH